MELIITGASGFVGRNLVPYLKNKDFLPKAISRQALLDKNNLITSGCIIHLAGKAHDLRKVSDKAEYNKVNYELTKSIYDVFLASDAKKFIFLSSVKAAADSVDGVLTEERQANPQTDYGKSKLMAETYIRSQPLPEGKSFYILRPCMIHGPGNQGNLNLLYKFVKKNIPYPLAGFENRRSFLSIENLCFVIEELLTQSNVPSGIYQVADDESLSTNEVVTILATSLQKNARLWHIPKRVVKSVAKIGDTFKLPLNTERLNKLTENYVVSNHKIKKALNIDFPVSAHDGLAATAKSFNQSTI